MINIFLLVFVGFFPPFDLDIDLHRLTKIFFSFFHSYSEEWSERREELSSRFVSNNVSRRGRFVRCNGPIWWHRDRNSSVWVRRLSSSELWSRKEQTAPVFNQNNKISSDVELNTDRLDFPTFKLRTVTNGFKIWMRKFNFFFLDFDFEAKTDW